MLEHLFIYNTDFKPWTFEHIVPIVLFIVLGYIIVRQGRRKWNQRQQWRYPFLLSLLLPVTIILWIILRVLRGEFDVANDIPLHMCNLIPFFLPFVFYRKNQFLFGIIYFWVMAGTLQAVFTPGLEQSFPHYWYFRYWLIHCGLIVFILYAVIILEYRPNVKDITNAFIAMNILFILAFVFNYYAGSNYLYTMKKPDQPSLLDVLGPWPWYILVSELVALLFFFLYYLPFVYLKRKTNRL